jgi:hypothetical protein
MNQFKKATKKIVAVAASATVASAAVFGSLGTYPQNFVSNDAFDGQVVVGADAAAMDSTSALSIISDLESEFSGDSEKVEITYKSSSSDGKDIKVAESGDTWNYGEANQNVRGTFFDESDDDNVLSDDLTFKNDRSDEDYSQKIDLLSGGFTFEHTLRDDLDDEISSHIFVAEGNIVDYTLEFDSSMDLSSGTNNTGDFVGEQLEILGTTYTVTEITFGSTIGIEKLGLIGGANKVSLGEGESTTVSIDGKDYTVEVLSVASSEVLLTVNGESESIDEFNTEEVGGVNIAVTDLVSSSRDSVSGYAEIVVGGNEITLEHNKEVKINDEDISDVWDDYKVTTVFSGDDSSWDGFTNTYNNEESDGTMLKAGDSWEDYVFGSFAVRYDGYNDVEWSEVELKASGDDKIKLTGTTIRGEEFSDDVIFSVEKTATGAVRVIGDDEDTAMILQDVDFTAGDFVVQDTSGVNVSSALGASTVFQIVENSTSNVIFAGTGTEIDALFASTINADDNITIDGITGTAADDGLRLLAGDADNQFFYEVTSYSNSDDEITIEDAFTGDKVAENKGVANVAASLTDVDTFTVTADEITVIDRSSDTVTTMALADELLVDLTGVTNATNNGLNVTFTYDEADLDVDTSGDAGGFNITVTYDATSDDRFEFNSPSTTESSLIAFGSGTEQNTEDNGDILVFVNKYGTKVEYDEEEDNYIKVMTPDDQIAAKVYLVTGDSTSTNSTISVDADAADDKVAELEDDGYTIVSQETVSSEAVSFDVSAPVLDSEVSGTSDMIVVGGPAVNQVAAELLGLSYPTYGSASGVDTDEAVVRYFESENSVLVYGSSAEDTKAAAEKLNEGGLSGNLVNVQ